MINDQEQSLFDSIAANKSAFFVSQQKDECDLSSDQKLNILSQLYQSNKMAFVQRYHRFLNNDQLNYIIKCY